jgi:catabolite regulation protein CreA
VIGNAVRVMQIATGQIQEGSGSSGDKNPAAVALGQLGGKARAERLSKNQRTEIAKKAAAARWKS